MTLRKMLGNDVERVHEQLESLLDSGDGLITLFDGRRMVIYTQGFIASPCQLELLGVEIERLVRSVVGGHATSTMPRTSLVDGRALCLIEP